MPFLLNCQKCRKTEHHNKSVIKKVFVEILPYLVEKTILLGLGGKIGANTYVFF